MSAAARVARNGRSTGSATTPPPPPPPQHASQPAVGELFVPFSLAPQHNCGKDAELAVRIRSIDGLISVQGPARISVGLRIGTALSGTLRADKTNTIKCVVEMLRSQSGGSWVPDGAANRGFARLVLPQALLSRASSQNIVCWVKITTPGFVTSNVLAVFSEPQQVPLEAKTMSLYAPKPPHSQVGSMTISIGRLISGDEQAHMAATLVQQFTAQLRVPQRVGDSTRCPQQDAVATTVAALKPSKGWLPVAGVERHLATADGLRGNALRLATSHGRWDCVRSLVEARCNIHDLAEDNRSALTAAVERGEHANRLGSLLTASGCTNPEKLRVCSTLATLLRQLPKQTQRQPSPPPADGAGNASGSRSSSSARRRSDRCAPIGSDDDTSPGCADATRRWESIANDIFRVFGLPTPNSSTASWPCDVHVLALDLCPSGKARRNLLCADGVCAALWKHCLDRNLADLARKLAVWIGLSVSNIVPASGVISRRQLLDVPLEEGVEDVMLARTLLLATEDERWVRVARVLVNLGACANGESSDGRSLLLFTLEQADRGCKGFRELLVSLLEKLGGGVDHWQTPTVLLEDRTAECPICFETLWTSTPTAFVGFTADARGREGEPHVICAHFFCFDCASQQYMKQQSQGSGEYHCPICRGSAQEVMPLPDIAVNPRLWFQFLDTGSTGQIDRNTIVQALEAMLPIDTENLREAMTEHYWTDWDKTHDDCIREKDFFARGGLLEWVRSHQHQLQAARARGPSPPLDDVEGWFKHWDFSKRRRIRRSDALRALCEVSHISSLETKRVEKLKAAMGEIWARHASADDTLSLESFHEARIAEAFAKVVSEVKEGGASHTSVS
eukprot:TRINITY_DN16712_c0_g1_i1.p1 TRINITY_DN16712_c0_g1~~TRINITY_DN16712_c0_g1_i1.p1  ORF type:complete len:850 (-),score=130.39 TRINITY_DN16712_c0_g1_i1:57-2606(-)